MEFPGSTLKECDSAAWTWGPEICICSKFPAILMYSWGRETQARSQLDLMFYDLMCVKLLIKQ